MGVSYAVMNRLEREYGLDLSPEEDSVFKILSSLRDHESFAEKYAKEKGLDVELAKSHLAYFEKVFNPEDAICCGKSSRSVRSFIREVFRGGIDLVVYSNHALQIAALYEVWMRQGNPELWSVPCHIALVSNDNLESCVALVRTLFPAARLCLLNASKAMEGGIPSFPGFGARIHLLSFKFLDTKDSEYYQRLSREIWGLATLGQDGNSFYNDLFCVMAAGTNERMTSANLAGFNSGLPVGTQEVERGAVQDFQFSISSYISDSKVKEFMRYPILGTIQLEFSNVAEYKRYKIDELSRQLLMIPVDGTENKHFFDIYADVQRIQHLKCGQILAFYPRKGLKYKVLIVKLGSFTSSGGESELSCLMDWASFVWNKTCFSTVDGTIKSDRPIDAAMKSIKEARQGKALWGGAVHKVRKIVSARSWNYEDQKPCLEESEMSMRFGGLLKTDVDIGIEDVFDTDLGHVEPLERPSADQMRVVASRKQLRKVRGGPGTGKSLTMMWHAANALERTHLPTLILCKTNSLTGMNLKRFLKTYCTEHNCDADSLHRQVIFMTMAQFLCQKSMSYGKECLRGRCETCCREFKLHLAQALKKISSALDDFVTLPEDRKIALCTSVLGEVSCEDSGQAFCRVGDMARRGIIPSINEETKGMLCDTCIARFQTDIFNGRVKLPGREQFSFSSVIFSSVMVDEAQSMTEDELQVSYLITGNANPFREYYLFCDEEQRFRGGASEQDNRVGDSRTKCVVVKAPAEGFDRFVTLKENHRVYNRDLLEVYSFLQEKLARLYDTRELAMGKSSLPCSRAPQDQLEVARFCVTRVPTAEWTPEDFPRRAFDSLRSQLGKLTWNGIDTILVVVDNVNILREWHPFIQELKESQDLNKWRETHTESVENREVERRMRRQFGEFPHCIHVTNVDCVQGQSFDNVIYVNTQDTSICADDVPEGQAELLFTGLTRARSILHVLDLSESGWLNDLLRQFNPMEQQMSFGDCL